MFSRVLCPTVNGTPRRSLPDGIKVGGVGRGTRVDEDGSREDDSTDVDPKPQVSLENFSVG